MNRRAVKAAVLLIEAAGVFLAAVAAFSAFLFWRLQSGPVSLGLFRQSAEFAIERALPEGRKAEIGEASLLRADEQGSYDLLLSKVEIHDRQGKPIADLSRITLEFSVRDLLHGALGPRRIIVVNPRLKIERGVDRKLSLGYARDEAARQQVFQTLTGGQRFRKAFQSAELVGAEINFIDDASGRTWRAQGANAHIDRSDDGYIAKLDGVFDIDGHAASMNIDAAYDENREIIGAKIHVVDAPVGDLLSMFYGPKGAVISAPVTGDASIKLTRNGEVISSRLIGHAGEGRLQFGDHVSAVSFVDFAAAFDPKKNAFDLEKFSFEIGGSRGELSGAASIDFAGNTLTPKSVAFDLAGDNVIIEAQRLFPEPLQIEAVKTSGVYEVGDRGLSLQNIDAKLEGVSIKGDINYVLGAARKSAMAQSPEIKASLTVDGVLDPKRLLRLWPLTVGVSAREFVETRILKGNVDNIAVGVDLQAGAIKEDEPTPDDAIALTFRLHNVTAVYTEGMTPLTGASGRGRLTGNRFVIDAVSAKIGEISLSDGVADFTELSPPAAPVHFKFTAKGDAKNILSVLNEKPLNLLASTNLDPARFVGDGVVHAVITRPNLDEAPMEDYGFDGEATFSDLTITEFYGGYDLANATGKVDLKSRSMTLTADATFGGAPIRLEWLQKFYAADGRSSFHVSGTVNSATGDIFGVPTREMVRGPVDFDARATGDLGALDSLSITSDFSKAALSFDLFDWRKEQGEPATGSIDLAFGKQGLDIRSVKLVGESVDIEGSAALGPTGRVRSASFPRFFLAGGADLSLTAVRDSQSRLDVALAGPFLNAGPFIEDFLTGGVGGDNNDSQPLAWGAGISIKARLDALALREGARYLGASLNLERGAVRLDALNFSAMTALDGSPLTVSMNGGAAQDNPRIIEAHTDDIGALFAGVFGVNSVRGGAGSMTIDLDPGAPQSDDAFAGNLDAAGIRVFKAPLLAKIFSAGSLTGLSDLLSGEGIELSEAHAKFGFRKGVFTLNAARASGPSVGITAKGTVGAGKDGDVRLSGAVAPMYQVNSILGKAPVVGDLFVNHEGEGVVALDYQVTGEAASPVVSVNPLSALTPGFLRRMFEQPEPQADNPPASETPQPEAKASAPN